jgi:hypothetical protein
VMVQHDYARLFSQDSTLRKIMLERQLSALGIENNRTPVRRITTSNASMHDEIGLALKSLLDRTALNRSPLARLAFVEKAAKEQYSSRVLPRGLALRVILESCIDEVVNDLSGEPALKNQCDYLRMIKNGITCKEISRQLGLSREHVSRVCRRKAIELVTEELLIRINNSRGAPGPPARAS